MEMEGEKGERKTAFPELAPLVNGTSGRHEKI